MSVGKLEPTRVKLSRMHGWRNCMEGHVRSRAYCEVRIEHDLLLVVSPRRCYLVRYVRKFVETFEGRGSRGFVESFSLHGRGPGSGDPFGFGVSSSLGRGSLDCCLLPVFLVLQAAMVPVLACLPFRMQPGLTSSLRDGSLQTRVNGGLVIRLLLPPHQ